MFGGSFIGNLTGINKLTATTAATVVSIGNPSPITHNNDGSTSGGDCALTAKYTVNGHDYSSQSSTSSTSNCQKSIGSTLSINYDPNDPGHWGTDVATMKQIMKLFPIIGIIIALTSLFTFVVRLLSIIFGWKLLMSGRALAKSLPGGGSVRSQIQEIRKEFSHQIFGTPATAPGNSVTSTPPQPVQTPQDPPIAQS